MTLLARWKRKIKRFFLAFVRAVEKHQRKVHGLKTCQSKRQFRLKNDAWRYALNRGRIKGVSLSPYHCRYCGYYHLTSKFKDQAPPKGIKL